MEVGRGEKRKGRGRDEGEEESLEKYCSVPKIHLPLNPRAPCTCELLSVMYANPFVVLALLMMSNVCHDIPHSFKLLLAVDDFNGCFNPTTVKLKDKEWVSNPCSTFTTDTMGHSFRMCVTSCSYMCQHSVFAEPISQPNPLQIWHED